MKTFAILELPHAPYIEFVEVFDELQLSMMKDMQLYSAFVELDKLPEMINGRYMYTVSNGQLINLSPEQVIKYTKQQKQLLTEQKLFTLNKSVKSDLCNGFKFDNHTFSLSQSAQLNWNRILSMNALGLYQDSYVSTIDDSTYKLTADNVNNFAIAYHTAIQSVIENLHKQRNIATA